ncbi:cell division protein PerM [Arthrobacter psychrochitiniphilus]|uniref:cell division protein PerM n=1 Tax=Arthrobacter psychrochitiniphilus TaxID=291045 RepID=UPI003F7B4349
MNSKADKRKRHGIPMPLWLQGAFEAAQMFVISALIVAVPVAATWLAGGFAQRDASAVAQFAGQIWLLGHGVPLHLTMTNGPSSASVETGTFTLLPLGLALIPFLLSWRAGGRLARASYTDQLWQPVFSALAVYAAAGLATGFVCSSPEISVSLIPSMLVPLIPAGAGLIIGSRLEAGSWGRLIGVNAAHWISKTSQDQRWAGSYVASVIRAGFVASMAALSLSALLLTINLVARWSDIVAVYQALRPGAVGGAALTLAQLGFMPNLAIWTLAWAGGDGFSLGVGSTVSPLGTSVAPVPPIPLLAALPAGELGWGFAALIIPVLAGLLGGWWFVRAGENHFDEWLSLKVRQRWLSLPASTIFLGAVIGAVSAIVCGILFWLSQGSAGIGRFSQLGPDPLTAALWVGAEIAAGVIIGSLAGPWLEGDHLSMGLPQRRHAGTE